MRRELCMNCICMRSQMYKGKERNKEEMHMKKKLLAFGMAVLMLTGCGSSSGTIRFGAAGLGGTYHMFSDALQKL